MLPAKSRHAQPDLTSALRIAAAIVQRYQNAPFETDAIHLFERIEREHIAQSRRQNAKSRVLRLLAAESADERSNGNGKRIGKHLGEQARERSPIKQTIARG